MGKVRRAEKKDIKSILGLLLQVNMVHHNGRPDLFKGPVTKYNDAELEALIEDEKNPVFVYESDDGNISGHAFCVFRQEIKSNLLTDIKTLYIDDICVDEKHRGQGIGKALYEYVKAYAKKNHFYNITLNVWECNPGAAGFYEAMGLRPQKTGMEEILK